VASLGHFDNLSSIDKRNRVRQAGWSLERNIRVQHWSKRVIISMIGFICTGTNPQPYTPTLNPQP